MSFAANGFSWILEISRFLLFPNTLSRHSNFFAEGYFTKQSNKNLLKRSNVCTEECFGKFEKITANINTKKNEKNPKKMQ